MQHTVESKDDSSTDSFSSRWAKRPRVSMHRNRTKRSVDSMPRVTVPIKTADIELSAGSSSLI
jgi:hypothetical protein